MAGLPRTEMPAPSCHGPRGFEDVVHLTVTLEPLDLGLELTRVALGIDHKEVVPLF
jgi:hypothetical protein